MGSFCLLVFTMGGWGGAWLVRHANGDFRVSRRQGEHSGREHGLDW